MSKNKNLATENNYDTAISGKKTDKEVSKTEEVLPVFNNESLDFSYTLIVLIAYAIDF